MKNTKLLRAIGGVDDELIESAAPKTKTAQRKKAMWLRWAIPAAACLVIAVAIVIPLLNSGGGDDFNLVLSNGVTVNRVNNPPTIQSHADLMYLTEEELFSDWRGMERVVFDGVVKKVDNIVLRFGSEWHNESYRAIAYIEVGEVYRGNIEPGTTVTVLLPAPVGNNNIWVEDTSVSTQMTVGTMGIFLPVRYNESSTWEENGNTLYLQELAEYGLLDGERHAFLEKQGELVFRRDAYPSVADATTMDEIRQYVMTMLANK